MELLVVIAIIALLVAIFTPCVIRAKRNTRLTICKGYQYNLSVSGGSCATARIRVGAFDCGCYHLHDQDLWAFSWPEGKTEEQLRQELMSAQQTACGP